MGTTVTYQQFMHEKNEGNLNSGNAWYHSPCLPLCI